MGSGWQNPTNGKSKRRRSPALNKSGWLAERNSNWCSNDSPKAPIPDHRRIAVICPCHTIGFWKTRIVFYSNNKQIPEEHGNTLACNKQPRVFLKRGQNIRFRVWWHPVSGGTSNSNAAPNQSKWAGHVHNGRSAANKRKRLWSVCRCKCCDIVPGTQSMSLQLQSPGHERSSNQMSTK